MSSLLSDSEKAELVADFQSVVDTFVRPLTVYQEATHTVIISDPNYNILEGNYNQNNIDITNTPNYTSINGRVMYDKNQEWSFTKPYAGQGAGEGQLKVKDATKRSVRIKVDPAGYELLKTAKKIELDGSMFDIESVARPHGLFVPNYWTFYFVRSL